VLVPVPVRRHGRAGTALLAAWFGATAVGWNGVYLATVRGALLVPGVGSAGAGAGTQAGMAHRWRHAVLHLHRPAGGRAWRRHRPVRIDLDAAEVRLHRGASLAAHGRGLRLHSSGESFEYLHC
jgi:hypothetical protein